MRANLPLWGEAGSHGAHGAVAPVAGGVAGRPVGPGGRVRADPGRGGRRCAVAAPRRLRVQRGERHDLAGRLRQRQHSHLDEHHVDDQRPLLQRPVVQWHELACPHRHHRDARDPVHDRGVGPQPDQQRLRDDRQRRQRPRPLPRQRHHHLLERVVRRHVRRPSPQHMDTRRARVRPAPTLRVYVNGVQQGTTQNVTLARRRPPRCRWVRGSRGRPTRTTSAARSTRCGSTTGLWCRPRSRRTWPRRSARPPRTPRRRPFRGRFPPARCRPAPRRLSCR